VIIMNRGFFIPGDSGGKTVMLARPAFTPLSGLKALPQRAW